MQFSIYSLNLISMINSYINEAGLISKLVIGENGFAQPVLSAYLLTEINSGFRMYYWNSNANIWKVIVLNKHCSNFVWASHLSPHFFAVTSRLRIKISWCKILRRTWTRDVEFLNLDAISKNSTTFDKLICWNNGDRV